MSSGVRTTQMPYFSFHRSSTPIPYSFGKPILNCCGGSLRTFGNMKRPVAASAAAEAAENAPQARPIQARRVRSGEVSSGSRAGAAAFGAAGGTLAGGFAAAPPGEATVVVRPARSGIAAATAGRGAAGRTGCAPVAAAAAAVAASAAPGGVGFWCGVAAGFAPVGGALGTSGFGSSAINSFPISDWGLRIARSQSAFRHPHTQCRSPQSSNPQSQMLQRLYRGLAHAQARVVLAE